MRKTVPSSSLPAAPTLREDQFTAQKRENFELEKENDLFEQRFSGLARGTATNGRFRRILFEGARLSAVSWQRAHVEDTFFRDCDLASLDAREMFVSRVELTGCRALGLQAPESNWRDAVFLDCNASMAQFRFAKMERVRFENCDLREADFQNADLRGVIFRHCDLRGAQFSFARLQNADFRTCETQNIGIDISALQGLIVSPLQAAGFAAILGLQVRWNDGEGS